MTPCSAGLWRSKLRTVKTVRLKAGNWSVDGLAMVESFGERFSGAKLPGARNGVLIQRAAVHTFGMSDPLEAFAVGSDRRVVEVRTLAPNRFAWFRGARYVVELPAGSNVPEVGSVVEVTDAG